MVAFMAVGHSPLLGLAGIALAPHFDCKSVSQLIDHPIQMGNSSENSHRARACCKWLGLPELRQVCCQPEPEVVGRNDCNALLYERLAVLGDG